MDKFTEIDGYIAELDSRLRLIARQNVVTAGMVELIGSHVTEMASRTETAQARIDASLARIDANLVSLAGKIEFLSVAAHIHSKDT
jgi:hypothetical protein